MAALFFDGFYLDNVFLTAPTSPDPAHGQVIARQWKSATVYISEKQKFYDDIDTLIIDIATGIIVISFVLDSIVKRKRGENSEAE